MKRFFRRKWLLRSVIVLVVLPLAGLLVARSVIRWRGQNELAEVISRLDQADPGWTAGGICAARNPGLPPPEQNSFAVVGSVLEAVPADFADRKSIPDSFFERPPNTPLRSDELEAIERQLAGCHEAIELARTLVEYPDGGRAVELPESPFDLDLEPIQKVRQVLLLLKLDALRAANDRRPEHGIHNARAALNAARSIGDDPSDLSQLVRIAVAGHACAITGDVLGVGEPAQGLTELQAELFREADFPRLTVVFRSQRAVVHQFFVLIENGDIKTLTGKFGTSEGEGGFGSGIVPWGFRTFVPSDHAFSLGLLTEGVTISRKPFDEQWSGLRAVRDHRGRDIRHVYSGLFLPSIRKLSESGLRCRGQLLATATAIACERYRLQTGRWPETLEAIPKEILPAVPNDPFTGRPICFRRQPDGIVVYSVGPDEKDDGGQLTDGGNPNYKPRDYGLRLWDPDRRGQPAPPAEPKDAGDNW